MDMIAIVMPPPPVSSPQSSSPVAAASEPLASTSTTNSIDDDAKGLAIALEQAERGRAEGGIPIGSALLTRTGDCLGSGHNLRVQRGSPTLHAEIAALEDAGRLPAAVYRDCTLVSCFFFLHVSSLLFFFFG
jgi:creatinine deaminase